MSKQNLSRQQTRTRKALMSATIRIILRDGYDKLTITAIADEANYTRRAFYLHFKNIDEIIEEICIDWYLSTHDEIMKATAHLPSPQREYVAWRKWVEVYYKNRDFGRQLPLRFSAEDSRAMRLASDTLHHMMDIGVLHFRDDVSREMLIHNEMRLFSLVHRKLKNNVNLNDLQAMVNDHFRLMFNQDPPTIDN